MKGGVGIGVGLRVRVGVRVSVRVIVRVGARVRVMERLESYLLCRRSDGPARSKISQLDVAHGR